jgi:hypothetical protein
LDELVSSIFMAEEALPPKMQAVFLQSTGTYLPNYMAPHPENCKVKGKGKAIPVTDCEGP